MIEHPTNIISSDNEALGPMVEPWTQLGVLAGQ